MIVALQFSSVTESCLTLETPWTAACQASMSITNSQSFLKLVFIELVMPSHHLILCHPLLPPSNFPNIRVFSQSQFFASGGQSIRISALASVLPMNIQDWFPLGWTCWISLTYSFPDLELVCCSMSSSNSWFLTCLQISQEAGLVVWYSNLLKNFPQFVVIHTVKAFGIVNKAQIDVFLELFCFFDDLTEFGDLVPLPFLNVAWTPGSSRFTHYWCLAWRIFSITVLVCEMNAIA